MYVLTHVYRLLAGTVGSFSSAEATLFTILFGLNQTLSINHKQRKRLDCQLLTF